MISTSVVIHFPQTAHAYHHIKDLGFEYKHNGEEFDVYVDDVPYELVAGSYQDPDEQLCEFYGINYDLVNCIESA